MAAVAATRRFEGRHIALGLLLVAPLLLAKSAAVYASDLWVIGTNDRLQATVQRDGLDRVILAGGDTLLVLLPGLATLAWSSASARWQQIACVVGGGSAVAGIVISGTRTSVLVASLLVLLAALVQSTRVEGSLATSVRRLSQPWPALQQWRTPAVPSTASPPMMPPTWA